MRNNNIFKYNIFQLSLSFIFIFFLNILKIHSFILFPLEYIPLNKDTFKNNYNDIKNPDEIMQILFYKNLITKIEIGTPPKAIPLLIKNNDAKFYFVNANSSRKSKESKEELNFYNFTEKSFYNKSDSISYKEEECKEVNHIKYEYSEICYAKEKIKFNKNNETIGQVFPINLVNNINENIPGYLGLLFNNSFFQDSKSFITLLINKDLIDNYFYFIHIEEKNILENKIKAQLYIGGLPHDIFPEKYSIENFKYTNAYISSFIPDKWRMNINKIYLNDDKDNVKCTGGIITFSYEIYHIIGTYEFHQIIKEMFMKKLIDEKKCFYSNFSQNIISVCNISFYYCKKSTKDILYNNLQSIKFYSMELYYDFELTKEELFYIKDDYIYLNILFSDIDDNYWTMGQIFTTKYNFVFNTNQKKIGFYKKKELNINTSNDNESNDINTSIFVICIIICIIFFICLGIFIGRLIFSWSRKKIVNDLIEELDYEYKIENDTVKPNMVESKYKSIGNKDKNLFFEMKNKFSE